MINIEPLNKAIKLFKSNKSPGEDGLTVEFYLKFWDLIGIDFADAVTEMLTCSKLTDSQYRGIISLLYKSGDREM